jgi:hypothetical protein
MNVVENINKELLHGTVMNAERGFGKRKGVVEI